MLNEGNLNPHLDRLAIRALPKPQLQAIVSVTLRSTEKCNDRTRHHFRYILLDHYLGTSQFDVVDSSHHRCLDNGFSLRNRIIVQQFYPHQYVRGLERIGIGTIAYLLALKELLEKHSSYTVCNPRQSGDLDALFQSLSLRRGMSVQEQFDATARYARTKGFNV